mgnify:CR=1 FL=1
MSDFFNKERSVGPTMKLEKVNLTYNVTKIEILHFTFADMKIGMIRLQMTLLRWQIIENNFKLQWKEVIMV